MSLLSHKQWWLSHIYITSCKRTQLSLSLYVYFLFLCVGWVSAKQQYNIIHFVENKVSVSCLTHDKISLKCHHWRTKLMREIHWYPILPLAYISILKINIVYFSFIIFTKQFLKVKEGVKIKKKENWKKENWKI